MRPIRRSTAAIAFGGIALASALSGCAPAEEAPATDSPAAESPAAESPSAEQPAEGTDAAASTGAYEDGDYSATGEYQSPGGQESVDVALTLEGDVVTEVEVTGNATQGNAVRYQTQFADGIAGEVVGKSIDELNVDKVAGSSLTSDGFNAALEQIKDEALA